MYIYSPFRRKCPILHIHVSWIFILYYRPLLSKYGTKDQDTIVDAIKELDENAEKVEYQEKEIKELQQELED